jgi:hypothetical protein
MNCPVCTKPIPPKHSHTCPGCWQLMPAKDRVQVYQMTVRKQDVKSKVVSMVRKLKEKWIRPSGGDRPIQSLDEVPAASPGYKILDVVYRKGEDNKLVEIRRQQWVQAGVRLSEIAMIKVT